MYSIPSVDRYVGNVTFAAKMLSLRDREYDQMRTFVRYGLSTTYRAGEMRASYRSFDGPVEG